MEDSSNSLGEEAGISRSWATAHFLTFYDQPGNCHGAGDSVILCYSEHIVRLSLLDVESSTILDLVSSN